MNIKKYAWEIALVILFVVSAIATFATEKKPNINDASEWALYEQRLADDGCIKRQFKGESVWVCADQTVHQGAPK